MLEMQFIIFKVENLKLSNLETAPEIVEIEGTIE